MTTDQRTPGAPDRIHPPWTPEQVTALNAWQAGPAHPFTCGNCRATLKADTFGWACPADGCGYTQEWAHGFMADPAVLADVMTWNPGWWA